jgi:hypothetical protein
MRTELRALPISLTMASVRSPSGEKQTDQEGWVAVAGDVSGQTRTKGRSNIRGRVSHFIPFLPVLPSLMEESADPHAG